MGIDNFTIVTNEQKVFALHIFMEQNSEFKEIKEGELADVGKKQVYAQEAGKYVEVEHYEVMDRSKTEQLYIKYHYFELQDLYKWLYYGEFGSEDHSGYLRQEKRLPELEYLLADIKSEHNKTTLSERVWIPMGLSERFIMVHVSQYYKAELPLKTLAGLMDRSSAFRGTRVYFKLDWSFIKEYLIHRQRRFDKEDFYIFEDRINFHQLPNVDFTREYKAFNPDRYRIVPRKLFFDFFPEYDDKFDIKEIKRGDSLID